LSGCGALVGTGSGVAVTGVATDWALVATDPLFGN